MDAKVKIKNLKFIKHQGWLWCSGSPLGTIKSQVQALAMPIDAMVQEQGVAKLLSSGHI